jgi:hypothetical protein
MTYLAAAFTKSIPQETLAAYWDNLQDLDADRFKAAIREAVRECKWFPTVATLRELATAPRPRKEAERIAQTLRERQQFAKQVEEARRSGGLKRLSELRRKGCAQ